MQDAPAGQQPGRIADSAIVADMSDPLSPPVVTSSGTKELPAYVSNGLIGLRVVDIPIRAGISILNGYAGLHPTLLIEANARTPYPVAGDICIDGLWLTLAPQQAEFIDQRYDFSNGELTTRFRFMANGVTVVAEVLTFCSRKQPTLVLQEMTVRADRPCDLTLRAKVDPDGIQGEMLEKRLETPGRDDAETDGSMLWSSFGGKSAAASPS
ncbi:MAG TPA: hypothetical protein VFM38_14330 [Candidatus Limnocylindrales bacterium]|nr:hypothetical protein [Candidatus Limnocylindrales bacterium]